MATTSPSSQPPDGPRQATIRARTRVNPVRPEVIDALDELERSLGDVSRWEQLLTGRETAPDWERPGTAPERGRHLPAGHLAPADEDVGDPDGFEEAAVALHAAIQHLDDRIEGIRSDGELVVGDGPAPILDPDPVTEGRGAADAPPVPPAPILLQARTVEPIARRSFVATAEEEDEIDRRRRNGRLLTWVGLALLVALGAVFFLPSDDGADEPEPPVTVPSISATSTPFVTTPLLPADDVTSVPVVPIDEITTTSRPVTQPTKKPTPATNPTTAPTSPATQPPLDTPGPSSTTPTTPATAASTTTAPTTPTTAPAPTTTDVTFG